MEDLFEVEAERERDNKNYIFLELILDSSNSCHKHAYLVFMSGVARELGL